MREIIFNFINQFNGNWVQIYDAISNKEKGLVDLNEKQLNLLANNSIFISDDRYFEKFKKMYMPPFALFYKGNAELLNEKIFGILGNIDLDFSELEQFRDNNYIICVKRENINDEIIEKMLSMNFKLIILTENNLDEIECKENNNIVYISEYCTTDINRDCQQTIERLIYALSDDLYIKSKNKENVKIIFENFENERKNCYIIFETKYNEFIQKLIDQKMLIVINNLNEILEIRKKQ